MNNNQQSSKTTKAGPPGRNFCAKYTGPTMDQLDGQHDLNEQNVGSAGLATLPPKVVKDAGYPDGMAFGGVP